MKIYKLISPTLILTIIFTQLQMGGLSAAGTADNAYPQPGNLLRPMAAEERKSSYTYKISDTYRILSDDDKEKIAEVIRDWCIKHKFKKILSDYGIEEFDLGLVSGLGGGVLVLPVIPMRI